MQRYENFALMISRNPSCLLHEGTPRHVSNRRIEYNTSHQYTEPYLLWRDVSQNLTQSLGVSAVRGTILVPSNGPPTCGMFQLSHWLQEGISNAVCHVTAGVTLCVLDQPIPLLPAEGHSSLLSVEMQYLFTGITSLQVLGPQKS